MEWQTLALILGLLLVVAMFMGQWTAVALGAVGTLMLWLARGHVGINSIGSVIWNTANNYVLIAVPMFVLLGEIFLRSGASTHFYRGVAALMGRMPGSLLHSNIVACALFSAISGSSVATAASVGTVAIPEMVRRGYQPRLVYGSVAAGGTLGILIPPSIIMVLYGALVEESVAKLFMAGIIPGFLLAGIFMVYIAVVAWLRPELVPAREPKMPWNERLRLAVHVLPILVLFLVVIGSMLGGLATPTEAAVIGAIGAIIVGLGYRGLTWPVFIEAVQSTVRITCMVMFIIIGAQILSNALTYSGVGRGVSEWITSHNLSAWALFTVLVVLYLILGAFIDGISMIYITLPVLFPVITGAGFDPIWFGIIITILIELGQITPPLGLNLFTVHGIAGSGTQLSEVVLGALPYVFIMLLLIVLLAIWPGLAMWLPSFM